MSTLTRKMGRCPSWARTTAPAAVIPRNPRREIVMIVFRVYFTLLKFGLLFGCLGACARAYIIPHKSQGLQDGGPVFQVRGEDLFHQLAGPFWNAHIELCG